MLHARRLLSTLVAAALVSAAGAMAAERVTARGNVPVISGGVGEDSVERLKAREREFNLKLVLTLIEGNYLADVSVTIRDAAGKAVVEHVTEGPIFMARLPAGTYLVTARYNVLEQLRKVALRSDRLHTEYLRWPADRRVDFPGPENGSRSATAQQSGAAGPDAAARRDAESAGIAFVSGGIGEAAQSQLLTREKEFNLKLVFTLIEGNYVADVAVNVKDASGRTVISHVAEGPFFLAQLPAGVYSLTATYAGQTQARQVSVAAGRLRTEYLRWKGNPETDTVLPPEVEQAPRQPARPR